MWHCLPVWIASSHLVYYHYHQQLGRCMHMTKDSKTKHNIFFLFYQITSLFTSKTIPHLLQSLGLSGIRYFEHNAHLHYGILGHDINKYSLFIIDETAKINYIPVESDAFVNQSDICSKFYTICSYPFTQLLVYFRWMPYFDTFQVIYSPMGN